VNPPLAYGIALPNYGPLANAENLLRLARRAEVRGVDSVWVSDHLVAPVQVESLYPYDRRADPKPGMGVIAQVYEPLTTLAFLAAATQRIRLGVSVYVMPYRNPVVTAKMVGTLDALSGGRVIFGVGVGWLREEFAALGQDARSRGRTTDEYLEVCRRLWRDDVAEFAGDHYQLPAVRTGPKPVQRPWPPIWIGGNSAAARRRAVALGDGLHLIDCRPDEIPAAQTALRSALTDAGRSPDGFTLSLRRSLTTGADTLRDDAAAYARHGLDYLVVSPRHAASVDALAAMITDLAGALATVTS